MSDVEAALTEQRKLLNEEEKHVHNESGSLTRDFCASYWKKGALLLRCVVEITLYFSPLCLLSK